MNRISAIYFISASRDLITKIEEDLKLVKKYLNEVQYEINKAKGAEQE